MSITEGICTTSQVDRYMGLREPTCQGGDGCPRCWAKYHAEQRRRQEKREELRNEIAASGDC